MLKTRICPNQIKFFICIKSFKTILSYIQTQFATVIHAPARNIESLCSLLKKIGKIEKISSYSATCIQDVYVAFQGQDSRQDKIVEIKIVIDGIGIHLFEFQITFYVIIIELFVFFSYVWKFFQIFYIRKRMIICDHLFSPGNNITCDDLIITYGK